MVLLEHVVPTSAGEAGCGSRGGRVRNGRTGRGRPALPADVAPCPAAAARRARRGGGRPFPALSAEPLGRPLLPAAAPQPQVSF